MAGWYRDFRSPALANLYVLDAYGMRSNEPLVPLVYVSSLLVEYWVCPTCPFRSF